jgi:xylulokinase
VRSPLLLGVDLGTTRIRVAAFDSDGRQVVASGSPNPLQELGPGRVEQRVEDVVTAADSAIQALTTALGERAADVVALGLTGQMGGVTGVDLDGHAVIPYDSPLDIRSRPQFERYFAPHLRTVLAKAGASPQWGQKMLYWRDEHPSIWARIVRFTPLAGYYGANLVGLGGGDAFAHRGYAALSGVWGGGPNWDTELCDLVGLTRDKLPCLVAADSVVGKLGPRRAAALGLQAGVPVVAGTGDAIASLLGAGAVTPGVLFDLSGTASVIVGCFDRRFVDPDVQIASSLPSVVDSLWYLTHSLFGGEAVRWFAEQFPPGPGSGTDLASRLAEWDRRAGALDVTGSSDLFFLPQLGGRWHPPRSGARGGWLGLTWGTRPEHMYRAILESIAYELGIGLNRIHELVSQWEPTEVRAFGGGAHSALWNQLKADVFGVPYRPLRQVEFGARGAALIAGQAVGLVVDLLAVAAQVETEALVAPRESEYQRHKLQLDRYRVLIDDVEQILSRLASDPT